MIDRNKIKRRCLIAGAAIGLFVAVVVTIAKYATRDQNPENVEFYAVVLGREVRPVKKLAGCTTEPWYGALDIADFYAMILPDAAFKEPALDYPKKMDFQANHEVIEWHNGPQNKKDQRVLSEGVKLATRWLAQEHVCSNEDLMALSLIPATLDRTDIRLAYVYRDDIGYVNRFALYVLDPTNKTFYLLRFGI